jgi:hypothetical protein
VPRVGAVEPGADGMVEEVGVAAVTHGKEEAREVVDDPSEAVEIMRDAADNKHVADEELIHGHTHGLKRIYAALVR